MVCLLGKAEMSSITVMMPVVVGNINIDMDILMRWVLIGDGL